MRDTVSAVPAELTAPLAPERDLRLDVLRGLALVTIYINHVPGTVFERFTSRNFGFSDAAEAFVVMSGIAAGLAYSAQFRKPALWPAVARVWGRAWTLYLVHVTITFMAIAIAAGAAQYFGLYGMIQRNNLAPLFRNPLEVLVGLPTLGHQIGYFNILPLYITLLLATPLIFPLALRAPWLLIAGSVCLWALAGQFRLNLPAYPNPGGWFFNPLSWQLIFIIGLCTGIAMRDGRRLVPVRAGLVWACGLFLLFVLAWMKLPAVGSGGRAVLGQLRDWGLPFYLTGFDKTFVSLPRLLHVLALFYLLSAVPLVRKVCASGVMQPLALMGRHALPVFALGSVLCILMQAFKLGLPPSMGLDVAVIAGGLLAQWALARTRDWSAAHRRRLAQ
ncbi:OpgC family protein [Plastorhodobacter daqingensis]|uniref:OpgC family protein n=1 Tax=Plastorhodobacter daqingensis TaxID=1387281 RepID=A0ABW2UFR7_9RHOB